MEREYASEGACGKRESECGACSFSKCTCLLCDAELGSATKTHASYKRRKDNEER